MGLFSWIAEKVSDTIDWVKDKIDDLKYKLSKKKYDDNDIEDQVDVDAALADFRSSIKSNIEQMEKKCMDSIYPLFNGLKEKTKDRFPDLVEIIDNEQENAEIELNGTFMKYVKEHLSKNDSKFLKVLKMAPGSAKNAALETSMERVFDEAETDFNTKLKIYVEHILSEFTTRLEGRISNQESQMNERIAELEQLKYEVEKGQIDVDALRDNCTPAMEASECIINILGMGM